MPRAGSQWRPKQPPFPLQALLLPLPLVAPFRRRRVAQLGKGKNRASSRTEPGPCSLLRLPCLAISGVRCLRSPLPAALPARRRASLPPFCDWVLPPSASIWSREEEGGRSGSEETRARERKEGGLDGKETGEEEGLFQIYIFDTNYCTIQYFTRWAGGRTRWSCH